MADENKYWIKEGNFVERIVGPLLVITVDEVEKDKSEGRTKTKGVKGHWITNDGIFQEGCFRTDELRPHVRTQANQNNA